MLLAFAPAAYGEGLFDFLFGESEPDRGPSPGYEAGPRQSRRRIGPRREELSPRRQKGAPSGDRRAGTGERSSGGGGYCVRICDGYFFPPIRSSRTTGQQSCEFQCPSTPVELYQGASIEQARNARGEAYSALPTAFSFRDKATEKCACSDPESSGEFYEKLARSDPTLRSGDIVVENSGPFVYNGASLIALGQASFLPDQIRLRLKAMLQQNIDRSAPFAAAARPAASTEKKPMQAHGSIEFGAPAPP